MGPFLHVRFLCARGAARGVPQTAAARSLTCRMCQAPGAGRADTNMSASQCASTERMSASERLRWFSARSASSSRRSSSARLAATWAALASTQRGALPPRHLRGRARAGSGAHTACLQSGLKQAPSAPTFAACMWHPQTHMCSPTAQGCYSASQELTCMRRAARTSAALLPEYIDATPLRTRETASARPQPCRPADAVGGVRTACPCGGRC